MSENEQAFQEKVDSMADDLESLARIIRSKARRESGTCVDRAFEILSVVNSGLPFGSMIRRAMLADEEPTQVADTWDLVGNFSEKWRPIFEQVVAENDHDIMAGVETKDAKFDLYCIKNYNTNEFFNRARELMADKERDNENDN